MFVRWGVTLDHTNPVSDLAIVGGGPAGLFAAFYAGLRSLEARVFEALPFLGGQVAALYPEKTIFDVGGLPGVRGADLVSALERQARFGTPDIRTSEPVTSLEAHRGGFLLQTSQGTYQARAVIIAVGVGAFTPRPLGVPEVDRWEGRGILHTVSHVASYAGRHVLVVGGGDSALDWASELAEAGATTTLVHRREAFRAVESSLHRAERAGVHIRRSTVVDNLEGTDRPERARIRHLPTEKTEEVALDAVVLSLGFVADLSAVRAWGLPLEGRHIPVAPDRMAVTPGIYAIGDAVLYPGKLPLIASAFSEAALAVNAAATFLDPRAHLHADHSTSIAR